MTELLIDTRDGIAFVTFNRPQARNALTFAMYEGLANLCTAANDDPAIRAIVITGAGEKAFAAGTDISQFTEFRTAEQALAYEHKIDRILTAIEDCQKPTIAAIAGACTGAVRLDAFDTFGNPGAVATGNVAVALGVTTLTNFTFFATSACSGLGTSSVTLATGQNAVSFWFRGNTTGSGTITITSALTDPPAQAVTITSYAKTRANA